MEKKRKKKSPDATMEGQAVASEASAVSDAMLSEATPESASESAEAEAESAMESEGAPASAPRQKVAEVVAAPEEPTPTPSMSESKPRKVAKKRKKKKAPVSRAVLGEKLERLEAKLEEKKVEAARAAREGFQSDPAIEDTSVPPVDLDAHDDFFIAGENHHHLHKPTGASGAFDAVDPKHFRKMTAEAHARRAHLSRYVKWAVGGASLLLVLGLVVNAVRGRPNNEPVRREVVHAAEVIAPVEAKTEPKQAAPEEKVEAKDEAKPEGKPVDEVLPEKNMDEVKPEAKDEAPVEKPKTAWQEKQTAKAALEAGSNGAAIAAGERSVALDSSDAEAWLILGAAYQSMGNSGQAKRAFNSCIAQGKKGPVDECRQMLGQ